MIEKKQVALHVRVKLNENFQVRCLGDEYLKLEPKLYISDNHVYNDPNGEYVHIKGEHIPGMLPELTGVNSGYAYLNELDLEYPIINK